MKQLISLAQKTKSICLKTRGGGGSAPKNFVVQGVESLPGLIICMLTNNV
jgi:hypothetical protein